MWESFLDKVIDLGIDVGLECCFSFTQDKAFRSEYKKTVKDFIEQYRKEFECFCIAEEFDYQGLCEYLKSPGCIDNVKYAVGGTQFERQQAQEDIYQKAINYTNAQTDAAKEQIRKFINVILEMLKALERKKISLETKVIHAETVDEIKKHLDENKKEICEEFQKTREAADNTENKARNSIQELFNILELKRILVNPSEMEKKEWCIQSSLEIKKNIENVVSTNSFNENDRGCLISMGNACNDFLNNLNSVNNNGIIYKNGNGDWEDVQFSLAMKSFRKVFREQITCLVSRYENLIFSKEIPEEY